MNTENLTYLKDNVKYMGFGESLSSELEKNIRENKADFRLQYKAEINQKPFEATLHFRKSDNTDMYFFNSYQAGLERKNKETLEQTFYLNKGKGITAKEAYNLLEGRSVHKELTNKTGEAYKAWVQLDLSNKDKNGNYEVKQYHENYGYDLKSAVSKFAVTEMDGAEKEKSLMQSLQKGNIQMVNMDSKEGPQKMFIEANPQFKTINLYDEKFKRVQKEALEQYHALGPSQGQEMKAEQKKDLGQDQEKNKDQKKTNEQSVKQNKVKTKSRSLSI